MDNEKLLKFAGFKEAPKNRYYFDVHGERKSKWIAPTSIEYSEKPPNFYKSADLCIKWLLPKIKGLAGVTFFPNGKGYWWKVMSNVGVLIYEGDTLAEAIEKYVDWVKENEE